jgi:N-acetylneuraminate synthase
MSDTFTIGEHRIGGNARCYVIGEIAQAHDGSLGTAHAYIDAVADAGADAVKFQTHIAAAESTPQETFRVRFSSQDQTRFDYWKRMEFSEEQWQGLADHARKRGIEFFSTPFSFEAVDLLERLNVRAWKVGSGEVTNLPMLERLAATRKPVLLSSGMSSWAELDAAVETVRRHKAPLAVLQCTTAYPCPPEQLGLNLIGELKKRYSCPIGFSDHSGTIFAGLAAATMGAHLLEIHVVFSRECFGPDVKASVTTSELKQLVEGIRFIHAAQSQPVDKEKMAGQMDELKRLFGKSILTAHDLPAGHVLTSKDLVLRKPGTGIPASRMPELVGRKLRRSVPGGTFLSDSDYE